jgi:tRNA(Ile)-lysidine synthase
VYKTIRDRALWREGAHIVAGVSGGADSVAMLYALCDWSRRYPLRLTVAHLHHGIRGAAADRDAEFVQQTAWSLGLPCIVGFADVPARAKTSGESIEMAARAARLEFFARVCEHTRAEALALAHTADDSAETLLLRLLRGGGLQSLGGISPVARVGSLRIVRPLIDVTRAQVEAFLRRHSLRWREDRTNRDRSILRNRLRHELMPLLESRYQPGIRRVLARTAERVREDVALLEPLIRRAERRAAAGADLAVDALRAMPPALCRHVLARWLRRRGAPESGIDADLLMRVQSAIEAGAARIQLKFGLRIKTRSGRLVLAKERPPPRTPRARALSIPGQVRWLAGHVVSARPGTGILRPPRGRVGDAPVEVTIRRPREGERLTVRAVWPGARFAPIGLRGTVKLQDLFVDHRVPRDRRAEIPLVTCGNEVVWVPGHRIARAWAVASESAPSVLLRFA